MLQALCLAILVITGDISIQYCMKQNKLIVKAGKMTQVSHNTTKASILYIPATMDKLFRCTASNPDAEQLLQTQILTI